VTTAYARSKTSLGNDWITRTEAARRAGVHRNTLARWEKSGLLRTRTAPGPTGDHVLVSIADLNKIIEARPRPAAYAAELAARDAELAACREELERVRVERDQLLKEVLAIARGTARRSR